MKSLSVYILGLITVGMFSFGCENAVQVDEEADNKTDTTSVSSEDHKAEELKIAEPEHAKVKEIRIELMAASNSDASGTIAFRERAGQVSMEAKLKGLNAGTHAIHLHENANCSSDDGKSAGGHWNPTNEQHGKWGDAEGYHKGDIGNFEVSEDGKATVTFETSEWCIGCEDETKNIVGRSVIIHQGKDDFISQPSGDAGKRIGCAEITDGLVNIK